MINFFEIGELYWLSSPDTIMVSTNVTYSNQYASNVWLKCNDWVIFIGEKNIPTASLPKEWFVFISKHGICYENILCIGTMLTFFTKTNS